MNEMTEALCTELKLQKDYLNGEAINTIYFGGGTPSLLKSDQFKKLMNTIDEEFEIVDDPEVTLEANPDDLSEEKLRMFFASGVNRLSIGVQSFHEKVLRFLNRAHNRDQALHCIAAARNAGFKNISIDLIYAIPAETHQNWYNDLTTVLALQPEHISSYCLTIEPKTTFGNWQKRGNLTPVDEEFAATQFEILTERLSMAGYEQYEISNFCLPGLYSRHNSGYWKRHRYLGIGPGAHSYNRVDRQFNISNNMKYMKSICAGVIPYTKDLLTHVDRVNEYLLTTLRTTWGADLAMLREELKYDLNQHKWHYLEQLIHKKYAFIENNHLRLTRQGMLLADKISSDLFLV